MPTLALLIFWSLANLAAFSYAGEKMPWLTVHIAAPMILAAGWAIGYLLETPSSSASQVARGWVTAFLALAAVFTARTAIQATYYNYDYAVEYLVYAHAAPAPKVMFNEIEKLSFEFTGSRDLVVAYDDDVRYPYWWYMRHYPNRIDFDRNPTSSIRDAAIIMVGEKNNQKVQPFLKGKYAQFRYARLWWPNMDYFSLKWDDIKGDYQRKTSEQGVANAPDMTILDYIGLVWDKTAGPFFTNSQFRSAAFQIWLNRDFTQWGQLMGRGGYSIADWGVADWMYVYIRKDYLERTSGMAIVQSAGSPETDPYQLARTNLLPDLSLGGSGSEPGQFAYPRGMAAASDGSLYVADSFNHRIQHFSADGRVLNAWGGPSQGAGADAAPGTFQEPWGVAVAPDGSVYVADTWNHRVQKFTADGRFLLTCGARRGWATTRISSTVHARWRWTRRAGSTWPTPATNASPCLTRTATTSPASAAKARSSASSTNRWVWPSTRTGGCTSPIPGTAGSRCSFPPPTAVSRHQSPGTWTPGMAHPPRTSRSSRWMPI